MCPPLGGALWREVEDGTTIAGHFIPPGYDVGTPIYAIHHNPKIYTTPFKFSPERWIVSKDNSKEHVDKAKAAFSAFSIGPRNCIGQGLAMIEISITLASVILQFDFRPAEGYLRDLGTGKGDRDNEYQTRDHYVSLKTGPFLQFRKRDLLRKEKRV